MKQSVCVLLLMMAVASLFGQDHGPYAEIRITLTGRPDLQRLQDGGWHPDHIRRGKGYIDAVVNREELELLRTLGASLTVLVADVEQDVVNRPVLSPVESDALQSRMRSTYGIDGFGFGSMGGYYTFQEIVHQLDTMAMLYPNLITIKDSIGASIEGRPIWAVKISDNPNVNEAEPEVLYTGLHHAREPEGMMALLYYMYYLLENYGTNAEVTHLINERQMYFIPAVNPDGYVRNQTTNPSGGGMWRKNRRNNGNGTYGVDLNRNYAYMWGYDNNGSSPSPGADDYRGTGPFSEPETQAVRDFCLDHNFQLALNYHTYGNLLIYPWGYIASFQTPDSSVFDDYTTDMTQFNQYVHGTGDQTVGYVTNGDSDDWMYGEQIIKNKILSMTPEVGPSFWPSQDQIFPLAEENLYPNLYLAWAAGPFIKTGAVTFSEPTYLPGDTGFIRIVVESKGLAPASAVVRWSTGSAWLSLLDTTDAVDLPAVTGVDTVVFSFVVDAGAVAPVALESNLQIFLQETLVSSQTLAVMIGEPLTVWSNDAENGMTGWTATGTWNTTTTQSHSPTHSFTESPSGNYPANIDYRLTMTSGIDFSGYSAITLTFWDRYVTEADYDYCMVEYSTDGGSTWKTQRRVSGSNPVWTSRSLAAPDAGGANAVKFRFRLTSDQSLQYDGWYVDDIVLKAYPREPMVDVKSSGGRTTSFMLEPNFPNPFNPSTTFRYELATAGEVRFTVYNVLGQRVRTLVHGRESAGTHRITWDGLNDRGQRVSSGVYVYRLEAGGQVVSRKMLLLK